MGIEVVGIQHCNVRLETREQAEDFYGRVLGLQRDPSMPWSDERKLIWWNLGQNGQLHTPIGERVNTTPSGRPIGPHFALAVKDIEAAKQTLEAEGIPYDEQVLPGRSLQLFVNDPAGNLVELFQAE
ncbi:MAG TPA: VOC family protein [Chloroflexota bacterium]|nr:VOC family protein [Chloroflexota bacterium]